LARVTFVLNPRARAAVNARLDICSSFKPGASTFSRILWACANVGDAVSFFFLTKLHAAGKWSIEQE
jgi:hypothetical protein